MLDEKSLNTLIAVLSDKFCAAEVRAGAARGLGYIGGHAARIELIKITEDRFTDAAVRAAAAEALGHAARD